VTIPAVPDIALETVRIRPLREGDGVRLHEVLSDEAVVHAFEQPGAPTLEAIQEDLPNMIAGKTSHEGRMHHLSAAIVDAETDELVGLIGLDIIGDGADIRIALAEHVRGHGRGREALTGLLTWARDQTQLNEIYGATHADNAASAAMMESCGMVEEAHDPSAPRRTFTWYRDPAPEASDLSCR
jgi:RimJ/RimL family protein N-acetyltransferase